VPVADAREAGARDHPERRTDASALGRLEVWGYVVWGLTAVVVAVPEFWALAGDPRWPTVSATVGRLEQLWSPTKAIVVALVTAVLVQMITYPPTRDEYRLSGGRLRRRTKTGRLTKAPAAEPHEFPYALWYFPLALLATAAAATLTAGLTTDRFVLGYALYGTMALTLVVVPNALAYWWAAEVPFPTLLRTLEYLDARYHPALLIVCSGLAVLTIHIVAFPWP
jgi:hypothetical protein